MAARPLLEEGLFRKISNGERVGIWFDKRIPQPNTFKPHKKIQRFQHVLIKTQINRIYLVNAIFSTKEDDLIRTIPISLCSKLDKLIWRCTTNGLVSVKSVYHLQGELQDGTKDQPSIMQAKKEVWTKIWHLPSLMLAKPFLWKACLNALTT